MAPPGSVGGGVNVGSTGSVRLPSPSVEGAWEVSLQSVHVLTWNLRLGVLCDHQHGRYQLPYDVQVPDQYP